ncbi:hypothetical protein Tco_0786543 [Tanacetum coccineum]
MNELVNDGIKLSKLEINTGFINGLPKKWLSFFQSLRNTNHVKDSELASLFGKLKYEENLIENSPDDEEDTRSSHEYLNDLEEEYQAIALLAKSKRRTKDFEAKYNKVKAKLALFSSSTLAPSSSLGKNKGLIAKTFNWDEEEVSSDDNEVTEVKALMALTNDERVSIGKESANNDNSEVFITGSNKPKLSNTEDSTLSNHDISKHPFPPLEKLTGVEPVSRPKIIKSILKSKSTFKAETLKGITINEPSSAHARGNKSSSVFKTNSAPVGTLKNVKLEDDAPLAIAMKELKN